MNARDLFWLAAIVMFAPHMGKAGGMLLGLFLFVASLFFKDRK